MSPEAEAYRGVLIRAITGQRPAMVFSVADDTKLNALCEQLARAEKVADLLVQKGWSKPGDRIDVIAAALPKKRKA
jgi:hypothetical protein